MMTEHICDIFSAEISPLKDPELFRSWMDRMPEERKRKILSLRPAESQRQSLGVGILLFRAMEQYGLEPMRLKSSGSPICLTRRRFSLT